MKTRRMDTRTLVQYSLFAGIILLLGLTPNLGYIVLPFANIVIVHVPVIIGSYLFGVKGGALLGFFFGLTSLISSFIQPDAISAIVLGTGAGFGLYNLFLIIMVLFVPRILVGVFSALVFQALRKRREGVAMAVAAATGSLTNTVLVLGALFVFAFRQAGPVFGLQGSYTAMRLLGVLLGIVALNGFLEAATAMLLCTAIGKPLLRLLDVERKISKT